MPCQYRKKCSYVPWCTFASDPKKCGIHRDWPINHEPEKISEPELVPTQDNPCSWDQVLTGNSFGSI